MVVFCYRTLIIKKLSIQDQTWKVNCALYAIRWKRPNWGWCLNMQQVHSFTSGIHTTHKSIGTELVKQAGTF